MGLNDREWGHMGVNKMEGTSVCTKDPPADKL